MTQYIDYIFQYESEYFRNSKEECRELVIDLTCLVKKSEIYLMKFGYNIINFDIIDVIDSNSREDLSHLIHDKELGPILRNEINQHIERHESYILNKISVENDETEKEISQN